MRINKSSARRQKEPTDEYNKAVSVFHSLGTHIRGEREKEKRKTCLLMANKTLKPKPLTGT